MREITDPNLLAELNGTPAAPKEVADPALLAQLNGEEGAAPMTFKDRIANALSQGAKDTLRDVELGGRAVIQGVASPVTMGSDILGAGVNYLAGKPIIPSLGGMVSDTLTNIGFPEPKTTGERMVGNVISGATGGGGVAAVGQKAAGILSGAGGALGASSAQEAGLPVSMQIGAGLVGGLAGGGIGGMMDKVPSAATPAILADASNAGIAEAKSFNNLRENLQNVAVKKQEQISNLFTAAKEKGSNAFIENKGLKDLAKQFEVKATNEIDADATNIYNAAAKKINELANQKGKPTGILDAEGGMITPYKASSVNDIETIRRAATQVAKNGGSKGYAGGDIKNSIDNFLLNDAKITGDKQAVNIWKEAISKRREYGQQFEQPQAIAKALTDDTNEAVEQAFVGSGGAALNKQLAKTYDDTLRALPANQKTNAGFQLRQSVVNRMIKNAAQSSDSGEGLSAMRLSNQIRNFRTNNQSMWQKFPTVEQKQLTTLEEQLRSTAEGGVVNKVYDSLGKIIRRKTGQNVELPRTLKPKTIVTMDDLTELMNFKPKAPLLERVKNTAKPVSVGINSAINNKGE